MEASLFDTPIGPRIEQALLRHRYESGKDLTWKELGVRVWARLGRENVDTSKISRIKQGEQQPTIAEGGAFAYELDVSPLWLFWELGEMGRFPVTASTAVTIEKPARVPRIIANEKPAPKGAPARSARKSGGTK